MRMTIRMVLLCCAALVTLTACAPTVAPPASPPTPTSTPSAAIPGGILLPNAFQPEGIAAKDGILYIGSIPTGAVYRIDPASGPGRVLVPAAAGRAAIGLKVDGRDRLVVCGGPTGKAFVYDAVSGGMLATYTLNETTATFINDVALAPDAAYFTDSQQAAIYRVSLPADGSLGGQEAVSKIALTGDFKFQPGAFNLNGIAWTHDRLIAVQSGAGLLFTIDPSTGATRRIDLGTETLPNGDGLLLDGTSLYVVQNRLNRIAVVDLNDDLSAGRVRTRVTNPSFDVPTTLAAGDGLLWAVNARFGVTVTPDTTYSIIGFAKP